MKIGVPRETFPDERRVAIVPVSVPSLTKVGLEVVVERDAGLAAGFSNDEYSQRGGVVVDSTEAVFEADVIAQVRSLGANPDSGRADLPRLHSGQIVLGTCDPLGNPQGSADLAATGATLFALEMIPRITRAQSMDVLSSMATIAGYRAVLLAAIELPKMFPLMMTAAGTLSPARVFVIGAGVAGLQAIATARRLGAVVRAYDVRPAVREQVESLGAKFVELQLETGQSEDQGGYAKALGDEFYRKQRELMARVVAESDVVVTTAAIPGKPSPLLITADAVDGMKGGSVIVDLAAERGGNCELSQADQRVSRHGVTILGPTNLPAEVPNHASQMFSKNVCTFLLNMAVEGRIELDPDDEIVQGTLVARGGRIVNPRIAELLGLDVAESPDSETPGDASPPTQDEGTSQ